MSPSPPPSSEGGSGSGCAAVGVEVFGPAMATSGTLHTITCTSCSTPSNLWGWTKRKAAAPCALCSVRMTGYLAARPATRALVWNRRAHKSYPRLHRGSLASLSMVKQSENLVP